MPGQNPKVSDRVFWQVSSKEEGMRLLSFLKEKLKSRFSTKLIKKAIDNKGCFVNGKVEFFSTYRLSSYDRIELSLNRLMHARRDETSMGKPLYEDEELLVINKPPGLVSDNRLLKEALKIHYPYFELVHRLDKETSGALIIAKSRVIKRQLENAFSKRQVSKCYLALVEGVPDDERGTIENHLGKIATYDGQAIWGAVPPSAGALSVTKWELLATKQGVSLLKVFPLTGRTHQIRVHLASLNLPILGDYQYARSFSTALEIERHMLHSYQIAVNLPKREIRITAPVPKDMQLLIEDLYNVPVN